MENEIQQIIAEEDDYSDISLRPMDVNDIDDFMVWATDDKVSQYCSWSTYTSKEQAMDYMTNIVAPHPWLRAICLKNRAIGSIPHMGREIGYIIAHEE